MTTWNVVVVDDQEAATSISFACFGVKVKVKVKARRREKGRNRIAGDRIQPRTGVKLASQLGYALMLSRMRADEEYGAMRAASAG